MDAGWMNRNGVRAMVAGLALGIGGVALAQQGGKAAAPEAPKPMQSFLVLEHAAFSDMLQDPKDAALKQALGMFPARLHELPGEIPDMPQEVVPLVDSLAHLATRPARFAVTYTPNFVKGGALGYGVILSSRFADKAGADALNAQVLDFIHEHHPDFTEAKSERFPSLTEIVIPVAPLRFGAREGRQGNSYDVIWGAVTDADAPFEALPKPTLGGKTLVNGSLDMQALAAIVNVAQTAINGGMQSSGQAPIQVGRELAEWGLIGSEAMRMHFESAYVDGAVRSHAVMENVEKFMEQLGTDKGSLTAADLAAIPADASSASMTLLTTKPLIKLVGAVRGRFPQADEALTQFTAMTGVDLEKDLLPSVGGVVGSYTSESTGGGGAGSMVALVSFANRAKFLEAHDKLAKAAREMMSNGPEEVQVASKYIRLRSWKSGATDVMSLTFPGVPMPLEISYAATDRWLVIGLTPQAVVGALAQIEGKGDKGIASRAEVAAWIPKGKALTSISFHDTARSIKDGYTITSMLGSAVANAMRSPSVPSREPGILVPSYKDLVKGVKSKVEVAYREGETIVVDGVADGSMLVGLASAMGNMGLGGSAISAMSTIAQMRGMRGGMHGMELNALPVSDRVAMMVHGVGSGPAAILSPEQWVLWTGVLVPQVSGLELAK